MVVILPKRAAMFEWRKKINGSVGRMKTFLFVWIEIRLAGLDVKHMGAHCAVISCHTQETYVSIFTAKTEEGEIRLWITLKTYAMFTHGVLC